MAPTSDHRSGRFVRGADRARRFFGRDVWARELGSLPTLRRWTYKVARVSYLASKNFVQDRCTWRAAALTYITVLSLVPLLAFAFSVAKGLGAYQLLRDRTIDPFLDRTFGSVDAPAPASEAGSEVRQAIETILSFVQDTNVASLGVVGLLVVLYAVLKLLGAIERSFNDIWGVHRSRSLARKLSDYLSTVVLVPLLLVLATTVAQVARSDAWMGRIGLDPESSFVALLGSLLVVWIGFAFLYVFMPNTRTRVPSALIGGVVGGTLWTAFQVAHVQLQVGVANYNAIYSTFAALPIFLVWLHVSWITVLLGAEVAYAHQSEASHRQLLRARDYDQTLKEVVAVRLVTRIAAAFSAGDAPQEPGDLADSLGVPSRTVDELVDALRRGGILAIAERDDGESALVLARDPDNVRISDVVDALKGSTGPSDLEGTSPLDEVVDETLAAFRDEHARSPHNLSIRELARHAPEEDDERPSALRPA